MKKHQINPRRLLLYLRKSDEYIKSNLVIGNYAKTCRLLQGNITVRFAQIIERHCH